MAKKAKVKADYPPDEALVQCADCRKIKMRSYYKKRDYLIESIVVMPKVKQSKCHGCKAKGS